MSRGEAGGDRANTARILVAHPSPDLYGSDWQLVETIHGLIDAGHEVLVALPLDGPLVGVLREAGARVAQRGTPQELAAVPGPFREFIEASTASSRWHISSLPAAASSAEGD